MSTAIGGGKSWPSWRGEGYVTRGSWMTMGMMCPEDGEGERSEVKGPRKFHGQDSSGRLHYEVLEVSIVYFYGWFLYRYSPIPRLVSLHSATVLSTAPTPLPKPSPHKCLCPWIMHTTLCNFCVCVCLSLSCPPSHLLFLSFCLCVCGGGTFF